MIAGVFFNYIFVFDDRKEYICVGMKKDRMHILMFVVVAALVAMFYGFAYPYHFFHREQFSLFLLNGDFVLRYFERSAWLTTIIGEFLTQYYYYIGGAPIILGIALFGIGFMVSKLLSREGFGRWIALAGGIVVMLWEGGRECVGEYPLTSTLSLLAGLSLSFLYPRKIENVWIRLAVGLMLIIAGAWTAGYGAIVLGIYIIISEIRKANYFATIIYFIASIIVAVSVDMKYVWWGIPNMDLENQFAIDTEWSRGIRNVSVDPSIADTKLGEYYDLLSSVNDADKMKRYWDEHLITQTMFMPVDPTGNYHTITAAGELWFEMGDMTMAEHATMLGMIFSPRNMGSRHIKRLAEINIINGDEAAASKYLYMLKQTSVHRQWAIDREVGHRTEVYNRWLEWKRNMLPKNDTLRVTVDVQRSMRNLLDSNISNDMARQYLLAYDMQTKDIAGFAEDYIKYGKGLKTRAIDEALLVVMATAPADVKQRLGMVPFSTQIMEDFNEFNQLYSRKNAEKLKEKFGNTYWFYCQFDRQFFKR